MRGGVAQLADAPDSDDDVFRPEIVPVGEGEVTVGQSKKKSEWGRSALKAAVEQGAFDNAKLLKGRPGPNPHKPITEQAPPDEIVGSTGTFRYEDGRGPVSNGDGVVTDDHIASLIDHGLVEISPDAFRTLGDYDEALADGEGAYPVEEIIDVPWMTIIDKGAGQNAELGEAEAEALAALPRFDDLDSDPESEQLARLQFLRFWPSGFADASRDELEAAADVVDAIAGVDAVLRAPMGEDSEPRDPELLAILDADVADFGALNDDLRDALDGTPFEVGGDYHWVPDLEHEHLAEHSNRPIGADADPSDSTDGPMSDDTTNEELREQLAAAEKENNQMEAQIEDLEDDKEDLETETDELEDEIEALEDENETLEENNETFQRALAETYAEQSPMSVEAAMERNTVDQMVEDLDDGPDGDDDDRSPKERLSEQLAAGIQMRGQNTDDTAGGELSDEQEAEAEQLAGNVLTLNDIQRINGEGITKREYVKREHDIDPAEYGSEDSLREALAAGGGD